MQQVYITDTLNNLNNLFVQTLIYNSANFLHLVMFLRVMIVHFALCPSALLSQEKESQATTQASGPSEKELALEESIYTLQQERDALSLQYQAQVRTSVRATES